MLNITKADEVIEVKNICFTIYSQPGLGKTSLSFTASKPLLLDFDRGSYRAVERGSVVQIEKWSDVASITQEDLAGFDTIIIDTVGKSLDYLASDIIASNPRLSYGGALNQQGWGQLGVRFRAFLKLLNGFGKDVVLIAHMDEQKDGDVIKERLKIQGGSKDVILTDSDVIARISIYNKERHLVFSPTESSFGKDPANLVDLVIPLATSDAYPTCLSDVITKIKTGLNGLSEAQVQRKSEIEWFKSSLPGMQTTEDINAVINRAKKGGRDISALVVKRAQELGFDFDGATRKYVLIIDNNNDETDDGFPGDLGTSSPPNRDANASVGG